MKWTHLPEPGGLYDQHPELLAEWTILFEERNKFQAEERRQDEANRKKAGSGLKRPPRRR